MQDTPKIEVRARGLIAADLDHFRGLARGCGFKGSLVDLVRFAVSFSAAAANTDASTPLKFVLDAVARRHSVPRTPTPRFEFP